MKLYKTIFAVMAIIALPILPGCDKKEVRSAQDIQLEKLKAKTWQLHSAIVDDTDRTSIYAGLTLTFGKDIFVATNGVDIWPNNGTWRFANSEATLIERGDGIEVTIEQLTASELVISMQWSETSFGPGRTNSVSGKHVFTFK